MVTDADREQLSVEAGIEAEPEIGRLLWMIEDCRQRTKDALAGMSDHALTWEPTPGENSIGTLLYHLAAIETDWLYTEALDQEPFPDEVIALFPADARDDAGRLTVAAETTLPAHLARLDAIRGRLLAAYRAMSLAEFRRVRHLSDYDVTSEYVLHHLMQHEAEHRGQIGLLRVLAGHA